MDKKKTQQPACTVFLPGMFYGKTVAACIRELNLSGVGYEVRMIGTMADRIFTDSIVLYFDFKTQRCTAEQSLIF